MRIVAVAALLAVVAFPRHQDEQAPCDLAKIEDAFYCLRCRKVRRAPELEKDGTCPACGLTPEKTKVCLKSWVPKCGMHDMEPHDKPCCTSPTCCRVETLAAPVNYKCTGCGATATSEERILHRKGAHAKQIQATCSRSGRFPHGGALPVKKPPKDD